MALNSELIDLNSSYESINEYFCNQHWSDGLPIIPPTPDRVNLMIESCGLDPDIVVSEIPPNWGAATVEKIAINAVMAGCYPGHFPVLLAAIKAISKEEFNLYAIQATTHPCGIFMIVNGPIAQELNINGGVGCFGPGYMSNAVLGRAMRLVLMNIGGAYPGVGDMSSQGSPGKFSFCIAENEQENPWNPIHVDLGYKPTDSTVTVVAGESPHNINDHTGKTAEEILTIISGAIAITGANNAYTGGETVLILGPEHAETISKDNYSKEDVTSWLRQRALIPIDRYTQSTMIERFGKILTEPVPMISTSKDLLIGVAGGPGKHSSWIPTFGGTTHSVTQIIS